MNRATKFSLSVGGIALALFVFVLIVAPSVFGYWFEGVGTTQVGVLTKFGKFVEVLPPGQYTDILNMGADIQKVDISSVEFSVTDPQVLLAGNAQGQIEEWIGVTVSGTVFRPGFAPRGDVSALTEDLWRDNRNIYVDNGALLTVVDSLARQAMKVCVGSRTLLTATVGSDRNDLAVCIDGALTELAKDRALDIQNVTVPEVTLRPETEASIAQVSASKRDAQLAVAQSTLVVAQGEQREAQIRSDIQVTAASQQEQFAAQATSASIQQTAIAAERGVIDANATNDAVELQYQQAQAVIALEIAKLQAQTDTAQATQLAALYQQYPEYASVIIYTAYAKGLEAVEKVFYIPADTQSINLVGGQLTNQNGQPIPVVPLVNATPAP